METFRYVIFICLLTTAKIQTDEVISHGSFVQEDEHEANDECRQLEKDIWKEYECCLQEGEHIFSYDVTDWFPKLPVLTEGPSNNFSLRKFSELYCRQEFHKLTCMNQISRRIENRGKDCIKNATSLTAKTDAVIQSKRIHYLCDDDARYLKEMYIHRANVCLQNKKSFLCTKYIVKENFNLEANKHQPDCRKFRHLVECLQDEWKNICSSRATRFLIGLLRKTYEQFHCPHEDRRSMTPMPASRNHTNRAPNVVFLFHYLKFTAEFLILLLLPIYHLK